MAEEIRRPNQRRWLMFGAIVLVLLNAWVAATALSNLISAERWLSHTLEVLTQTEAVNLDMIAADSATRAYLLTGAREYDRRYRAAAGRSAGDVKRLQQLTADNQSQQQRITVLRSRISVRLAALEAAMAMKRGHPGTMDIAPTVLDPVLEDSPDSGISVRYALAQMENEEHRLRDDREKEAHIARLRMIATFAVASLLDLLLVFVAFRQLYRASEQQQQLAQRASEIATLNSELTGLNAELETRVAQRTRELEVSNKELEAFSYSVSHDLRAPLRTIDGFSLALAEDFSDVLNDEGRDYIQRVRGGVQRMGTLIDALLQLSRVTRSDVQREEVDLSRLATLVFSELSSNDPERRVRFTAEPDLICNADVRLMRVAFENLLGNALKFTSKTPDAAIEFGHTSRDGQTVYFIRDNGAGFDMQYVDRLFTAFQRLHGDREFKGSGIGLATVSRIIRRHHGTIWAEGEIGHGATFFFTLSADSSDPKEEAIQAKEIP